MADANLYVVFESPYGSPVHLTRPRDTETENLGFAGRYACLLKGLLGSGETSLC